MSYVTRHARRRNYARRAAIWQALGNGAGLAGLLCAIAAGLVLLATRGAMPAPQAPAYGALQWAFALAWLASLAAGLCHIAASYCKGQARP